MSKESTNNTQELETDNEINAMPTKELFIEMLTKDISLIPAIIDLVDNSVDGAKRLRSESTFKDLWVRLEISPTEFKISDNCGGISVDTVRKYAFRFGRDPKAEVIKHSIGRFGVGMKRSIFKLGTGFNVTSNTCSDRFVVNEDVNNWAKQKEWKFMFSEVAEDMDTPVDKTGTIIIVKPLHSHISEKFGSDNFITQLKNELQTKLQYSINKNLSVTVNQIPIDSEPLELLSDKKIAPAYKNIKYSSPGQKLVRVKLFCGLGSSKSRKEARTKAGWYVFCNGRLILEADKTAVTGWGAEEENVSLPGLHGQYNQFRGYAYFDCDDPARLPWNTTKTGIDSESDVFRAARLEMMNLALPVKNFFDSLKKEKDAKRDAGERGPLESVVENSPSASLNEIKPRTVFKTPLFDLGPALRDPNMQRIQYDAPLDKVTEVMKVLKVRSFKKVGEKTFEYFYDAEVEE